MKKIKILAAFVLCLACLAALVGCSDNKQDDAQAQNRKYMSSVGTITGTLSTEMTDFSQAVKDGEVISLSSDLSAVDTCVSDLEALSVPDALKDVHVKYVSGAKELQTALKDYVALYEDMKAPESGSADYADYDKRLAEIQKHYDAGMKDLQEADEKAKQA